MEKAITFHPAVCVVQAKLERPVTLVRKFLDKHVCKTRLGVGPRHRGQVQPVILSGSGWAGVVLDPNLNLRVDVLRELGVLHRKDDGHKRRGLVGLHIPGVHHVDF